MATLGGTISSPHKVLGQIQSTTFGDWFNSRAEIMIVLLDKCKLSSHVIVFNKILPQGQLKRITQHMYTARAWAWGRGCILSGYKSA